jgi:hypothetical protein
MYCICCKKNNITPYDPLMDGQLGTHKTEEELLWRDENRNGKNLTVDNEMINGGIIQIIHAGFGSLHDTDSFIIGICDSCIVENLSDGTLLLYKSGDYVNPDKHVEESKRNYRRRKNLDGLIGE